MSIWILECGDAGEKLLDAKGWSIANSFTGAASVTMRRHRSLQSSASYITDPAAGLSMTFDAQRTVAITPYIPIDQRV
jgi:hypothetical protein